MNNRINNRQRLLEIQEFLTNFGFDTIQPDFIGAWISNDFGRSFYGPIDGSYMMGYMEEESMIVVDALGISVTDNPFIADSFNQNYDAVKAHADAAGEALNYYQDPSVELKAFWKQFLAIRQLKQNIILGKFEIVGEGPAGIFLMVQDDSSSAFKKAAGLIKETIASKLGL